MYYRISIEMKDRTIHEPCCLFGKWELTTNEPGGWFRLEEVSNTLKAVADKFDEGELWEIRIAQIYGRGFAK
jgi:hypothetical protein